MKKLLALGIVLFATLLSGCGNKDYFDTVYTYDYAIIELQNGEVIEGEVQTWKDYEGEQLQVKIDGVTYLVHSENITLMYKHMELPTMPVLEDK